MQEEKSCRFVHSELVEGLSLFIAPEALDISIGDWVELPLVEDLMLSNVLFVDVADETVGLEGTLEFEPSNLIVTLAIYGPIGGCFDEDRSECHLIPLLQTDTVLTTYLINYSSIECRLFMSRSFSFHSKAAVRVTGFEPPCAVDLSDLRIKLSMVEDLMLPNVLLVDTALEIEETETALELEFTHLVRTLAIDDASRLAVHVEIREIHLVPISILLVLGLPRHEFRL
jgi:hypothetical protein